MGVATVVQAGKVLTAVCTEDCTDCTDLTGRHRSRVGPWSLRMQGIEKIRETKLLRVHDGCLGDKRRRRTRVAAKSFGEPLTRL